MNPVSVLRVKFVSQNLRYFISFKGIPFTYTDVPSPCYQQTEKVLPHEEMEECEAAFGCTPPVSESIFRKGGGIVELMNCGKTYIVEFVHLHTRGFTMSSSNVYLIKF